MRRRLLRHRPVPIVDCTDQALLDTVRTGSRPALKELFDRHGAAVHHLAGLVAEDDEGAERIVEDVFVTLARRAGRLEDDVTNVRLGLMAMVWRRASPQPRLPGDTSSALAITILSAASVTEVAGVLQADRHEVAVRLRSGLAAVAGRPGAAAR
jgi:hypothetical protein